MDFRSQFINDSQNGLLPLFEEHKISQSTDPIDIKTIGVGLRDPANIPVMQQPAVFFDYGDTRRLEGERYAGYEIEAFTVDILAVINATNPPDRRSNLIERTGAMRLLIDQIREEVRSLSVSDEINIQNVVVSHATKDRRALSEYAAMHYGLTYIYEYQ